MRKATRRITSTLSLSRAVKAKHLLIASVAGLLLGGLGTAASRADILYVSNNGSDSIAKFASDGVGSVFANTGLSRPSGLAFDSAGSLYAADVVFNRIVKLTGGVGAVFASTGLNQPYGMAFDSTGNLFAANSGNSTIEKFASGGVASVFASTGLTGPVGTAFDSAGNLYVANVSNNTIQKFTSGGVRSVFASTGLNQPSGLAFDSEGSLYVANYGSNTIVKFTSGGVGSVFATTGLNRPQFLAFTDDVGVPLRLANQVPEPASAVLLLGGAALLGLRRRR